MKFNGVLFDLDGTLADSLDDIADSVNQVLRNHQFPAHSRDRIKSFIGNGIQNLVRSALPEAARDERTVTACHVMMMDVYSEHCLQKTRPFEGIPGLLDVLRLRGMKLGVLSNKADELTKKVVRELLPGRFDAVMGLRPGERPKPDPAGALQISGALGVKPEELVLLGDMRVDMQTAKNAGMFGAGALWGFGTRDALIETGADRVLNHPMDLLEILELR